MLPTAPAERAILSLQLVFADRRSSDVSFPEVAYPIRDVPIFVFWEPLRVGDAPLHRWHGDAPLGCSSHGSTKEHSKQ
jgi:hypothetical protein